MVQSTVLYLHQSFSAGDEAFSSARMVSLITQQGNARVGAMSKLLRDPYFEVRVKCLLMLTALRPCLEYAAEVLAPNTAQFRA